MNLSRLDKQIDFILEIDKLKSIYRTTKIINKSRQENDAEHSWHLCMIACILEEYSTFNDLDMLKIIKMLLIHDMAEIVSGDTYAFDIIGGKNKKKLEKHSFAKILSFLPQEQAKEYFGLWDEFNACKTNESKYAKCIDKIQPFLMDIYTNGETWIYGQITKKQLTDYLSILSEVFPILWGYILTKIDEAVYKGFLIED